MDNKESLIFKIFKRNHKLTMLGLQRDAWKDKNYEQILEDQEKAWDENLELDTFIEGYIKKTDWGYIHRQERLEELY